MMFLRKRHSLETGFTLLEVLVSVTLIALMAVAISELFSLSMRSWSRGMAFIDTNQRYRSLTGSVQKQIASAYPLFTSQLDSQQSGTTRFPIFIGDESTLQFVSFNSFQFAASPGLTFVKYEFAENSNGGYSLIETETPYTGQLPDDAALEQARVTNVFDNLTDCTFEYYSVGDANNSPQWLTEWNGQTLMKMPGAVRLTMVSLVDYGFPRFPGKFS
jgi:general secretion pathway protein J